jgi:hypothetical protein
MVAALLTVLSLLLSACSSQHDSKDKTTRTSVDAKGGTLRGSAGDQTVTITVPPQGATDGTAVKFRHESKSTHAQDISRLGLQPLGDPVDVTATHGKLSRGKITLSYDPKKLPQGTTANQVGIMVFDEQLGAWFPLLDSHADPKTHQVTGTAPHFSLFKTFVINPLKHRVEVAGHRIKVLAKDTLDVMTYFQSLITATASTIVEDLFAIPPEVSCEEPSTTITVGTHSAIGDDSLLDACTNGNGKTVSLRMSNGAAYPVLLDKLPAGVTVSAQDVMNSGDTVTLLRNMYWMRQGQRVIGGAKLGSVTVNGQLAKPAQLHGHMDARAVAYDMLLSVVLVFSPAIAEKAALDAILAEATTASTAAVNKGGSGLAAATKAAIKAGVSEPETNGKLGFGEGLGTAFSGGDCVLESQDARIEEGSFQDHMKTAVKVAQACGKIVFEQFNGTNLIQGLLESLKVVPEIVQAELAGISNALTGGKYKLTSVYADLTPNRVDVGRLAGKWYNDQGSMTINADGTGVQYYDPTNDFYVQQPCNSTPQGCYMKFRITRTDLVGNPANAVAKVTANNGDVFWRPGQTLYFYYASEDGRAIEVTNPNVTTGTDVVTYLCRYEIKDKCAMGGTIGMPPG